MNHTDEILALRQRVAELEQNLVRSECSLDAEQDRLYWLEQSISALTDHNVRLSREIDNYRGLLDSPSYARSGEMCVRPCLGTARLHAKKNVGFIIMPFGTNWASKVEAAIDKALQLRGMVSQRGDRQPGREIMKETWIGMCEAGLVIADVTEFNPNVMYELGLMDAVGQDVVLIGQSAHQADIAFDLLGSRILIYSPDNLDELTVNLKTAVETRRSNSAVTVTRRG